MSTNNSLIPEATNFIPLSQAIAMTALYRSKMEAVLVPDMRGKQILPICETFNREALDYLLAEDACAGIRIYLGMDESLKIRVIAVGVNTNNEDMLPTAPAGAMRAMATGSDNQVVEDGQRCPDDCPPDSPLNS